MSANYLGEALAIGAAVFWSLGLILFRLSTLQIGPIALNLLKNVVAAVLLLITVLLWPGGWRAIGAFTWNELAILCISGVIGLAVADTLFFFALGRIGVGMTSIADCMYSPMAVLFAYLLLGESLSPLQYVGGAIIVCSILVVSGGSPPAGISQAQLALWMAISALAVTLMAFGIVYARPVIRAHLHPVELVWVTNIRLIAGTVFLAILTPLTPERRTALLVFRPGRVWRTCLPAAFIGTYLCMLCWVSGFGFAQAGVAALLNQTSVIFSLLLAAWLLREPLTGQKLLAVCIAMIGIVTLTQGGPQR